MINFAVRNLKLYFRDRSSVFFSLLAVFIIIGLYAVFLGDVWLDSASGLENARFLMNSWLVAGLMAIASVTTTMGAFSVMVDDQAKKIYKDFYSAPVTRGRITGGYLISAFLIGIIMSVIMLAVTQAYILMTGGALLGLSALVKVLGLIVLSAFANTALICFIVSFFRTQSAFGTASSLIGTVIGFLTGIYLPVGSLPQSVQLIIKIFPVSHAAALFRQVIMQAPMDAAFANIPVEYLNGFKESMGVVYNIGGHTIAPVASIAILIASSAVFYLLALLNMSRKRR